MGDENKTLLTIVIVVIIAVVILWVIMSMREERHHDNGGHGIPSPVGGVVVKTNVPGEVTISWDPARNASSYRVFLNVCDSAPQGKNKSKKTNCGSGGCCPTEACESCVSQTNYQKVVETEGTSIIVETCSGCVCYLIVPYNHQGDAGPCNEVRYAYPECLVPKASGRVEYSNCDGTKICWDDASCCETMNIYVDGTLFESVPHHEHSIVLEQIPQCIEISLQCESSCGLGEIVVIQAAHHAPAGALMTEASSFRSRRRQKYEPKAGRRARVQRAQLV